MEKPLTKNIRPDRVPPAVQEYERAGGYQSVAKALRMGPKEIQEIVTNANLMGRGGGGFNAGLKWSFVPMGADAPRPKYLVANADEMEPGAFKDRLLMEGDPHQLIEGMIVSAYAIQADIAFIFLRWEYKIPAKRLSAAIAEAYERGYLGKNILGSGYNLELRLHTSAGRYMCGEETGLLNALEGKRANPREKPPYPQVSGLWGKPTVVNNVETLCNIPHIVNNGADWFRSLSRNPDGGGGTKIYGVSGRVKKPGLWELPMGTTVREILEGHAGGMRDGYTFRSLIPGGASTEFILERDLDARMDFISMQKIGSRMGTGTMIVLDDKTCPIGALHNMQHFFAQESCGWCTPCWSGLQWVEHTLAEIENGNGRMEDLDILEHHTRWLQPKNTFCALAPGAMEPLQSGLKLFREDFERHIKEKKCTYK